MEEDVYVICVIVSVGLFVLVSNLFLKIFFFYGECVGGFFVMCEDVEGVGCVLG